MNSKSKITIVLLFCIQTSISIAQTSPIRWVNNSYNINVDTFSIKKIGYGRLSYDYARTNLVNYTFENIGSHVTFIDTTFFNKFITKPNATQTVSLDFSLFKGLDLWKKRDTLVFLSLPFYYEGKIYSEKVACSLTFGKSKLITHDNFQIDTTDWVTKIIKADTIREYPSLKFIHYFTIKNISNKPIFCTKELIAWNDSQNLRNGRNDYEKILPGQTYKIPAKMNMDRKYRFNSRGIIEVFADDISETYECVIISNFKPIDK